jgi:hypothetical protein
MRGAERLSGPADFLLTQLVLSAAYEFLFFMLL